MSSDARTPSADDITVTKSDGWFVAKDAQSSVVSQGKTKADALENLADALRLHERPVPADSDDDHEPSDAPWLD
jgi:predicted RNase H-like HicB family nuclease